MIFISHRHEDTRGVVTLLHHQLSHRFPGTEVFCDFHGIQAGQHWRATLGDRLQKSTLLLAVVGPSWGGARFVEGENAGRLRLDDKDDWVRQEICAAIRLGKSVIPVLIDNADLPPTKWGCELDELPILQAARLRMLKDFEQDFSQLCVRIEQVLREHDTQAVRHDLGDIYFLLSVPKEEQPVSFNRTLEDELRRDSTLAKAKSLELSSTNYESTYSRRFAEFLTNGNTDDWLFTIRPEEQKWPYQSPGAKRRLLDDLAAARKHVVFFESDDDLLRLARDRDVGLRDRNPIVVINTDPTTAVLGLIHSVGVLLEREKSVDTVVIITIAGPDAFVAHARRREFNKFLSAVHQSHSLPPSFLDFQEEDVNTRRVCDKLKSMHVMTATTDCLKDWSRQVAKEKTSSLLGLCHFNLHNCRTMILCGSDQIALGAYDAVKGYQEGRRMTGQQAIDEQRVSFYGIDGLEDMTKLLSKPAISGYTMVPDFGSMRDAAARALFNPASIQRNVNFVPLWGWDTARV